MIVGKETFFLSKMEYDNTLVMFPDLLTTQMLLLISKVAGKRQVDIYCYESVAELGKTRRVDFRSHNHQRSEFSHEQPAKAGLRSSP